jgi:hypothetical protein
MAFFLVILIASLYLLITVDWTQSFEPIELFPFLSAIQS